MWFKGHGSIIKRSGGSRLPPGVNYTQTNFLIEFHDQLVNLIGLFLDIYPVVWFIPLRLDFLICAALLLDPGIVF